MLDKKWNNNINIEKDKTKELSSKLELPFLTSRILINRGYDTIQKASAFINPKIENLYDPNLFIDMKKTINRINDAIDKKENIWIYGDYDVDGITSVSILLNYFNSIDYPVNYYIPNRKKEGYGLSKTGVEHIFNNQGNLIISVDCGITGNEMVDYCNELNMDIVITDHHTCSENLPNAFSILNPKNINDNYPYDMLAGVGIAFKLIQGLSGENFKKIYSDYIDIVAFGTVADIAPLDGENRIISKLGINQLNNTNNLGMKALIEKSELNDKEISAGIIGFRLAPQINAAGRLGEPELGVKLLTSKDEEEVKEIAETLFNLNEQRKMIEKAIFIKAQNFIEKNIDLDKEKVIVVYGENWHSGVIGIVASRITEKYLKPAIVLSKEDEFVKGSARSVGNFNIHDALKNTKDFLIGFGGHKMAAGLTLESENVDEFRKGINKYVLENVDSEDLIPIINYEGNIKSDEVVIDTIKNLECLKPFGVGNPKPKFVLDNCSVISSKTVGKDDNHLKLMVSKDNITRDVIGFGLGDLNKNINKSSNVDILVSLDINEFNGIISPQLMLKDLKQSIDKKEVERNSDSKKDNTFSYKYLETLFISIKNNLSYFINIDFKKYRIRKEKINNPNLKTLILINSLNSIKKVDKERFKDWKFNFNQIDSVSDKDILINPILRKVKIKEYDQIVFYDLPIRKKTDKLIDFVSKERFNNLIYIFREIPIKRELIKIYKYIVNNSSFNIDELSKELNFSKIKLFLALEILKEINVIDFLFESGKISINILPADTKRTKIEDNQVFKKLLKLKRNVM